MNKVIIILGPTGVGKTGFSILLARALNSEIISADSMQVYRHMDIGTAKPSQEDMEQVPHHMIDIVNPDETFSAGLFKEMATDIIGGLHERNKIPVIVGGTGLYIRSLTRGLFEGTGADEELREKLQDEEAIFGKGYLYRKLRSADPEAAEKIQPNDLRRTVRALEIIMNEQKGLSIIREERTLPSEYDFIKIGLTRERKELYTLIEERVDMMLREGLLDETRKLLHMKPDRTALQALGYKELQRYLDGAIGLAEAVRLIKKRTKMFAKRQFTWFKKERDVRWVDITGIKNAQSIFTKVVNDVTILQKLISHKGILGDPGDM